MKRTINRYAIVINKNSYYWMYSIIDGFSIDNEEWYKAQFSSKIEDATLLTKDEANREFSKLSRGFTTDLDLEISALDIIMVEVTFEIPKK